MNFIRKSLVNKAAFVFSVLLTVIVIVGIVLIRVGSDGISLWVFLSVTIGVLILLLALFLLDVVIPLGKVIKQVKNLLTGNNYKRVEPTTIDEIGIFTHFFNEITQDLEKVSFDLKERKRMSTELDIAARIQKDVLPKEAPEVPGLDIVAKTKAAAEVGGDSFDFLSVPDGSQIFIYIGDVTGHGVPAGLVMMMVDTLVHSMVSYGISNSKDVIIKTNELLTPRISSRLFMTAVMLRWDKNLQRMYYTGAGHEHILVFHAKTEVVDTIRSGGIALGMIPDNSKIVEEKEIPLQVGDSIVLYSDGIAEARNQNGEMYGIDRLAKALHKHGFRPSAENIFDSITKDFSNFVGEYIQTDDITMIVIKYLGKDAQTEKVKLHVAIEESKHKGKNWDWN